MKSALGALAAVDFQWTRSLRDVWADSPFHVDDLNGGVVDRVVAEFFARTRAAESNPIGHVLSGRAGAGKTHLLGALRQRVWAGRGWFVLIDVIGVADFWRTAALAFLESLSRPMPGGQTQASAILSGVLRQISGNPAARRAVAGRVRPKLSKTNAVDLLIAMLGAVEPAETRKHQDVVRALALLESGDIATSTFANMWLQGHEGEEAQRRELDFLAPPPPPAEIVRGLLWIMGLSGPTLIAVDQIDSLVAEANALAAEESGARRAHSILQTLAGGLMDLHDLKRRAMTLVSCLESTWPIVKQTTVATAADRFRELAPLAPISSAAAIERLIGRRVAQGYAETGFVPPYATYPFTRGAIESAVGLRPRTVLMRCHEHQEACVTEGRVRECGSLAIAPPRPPLTDASSGETAALDEAFARARAAAKLPAFDDEAAVAEWLIDVCKLYLRHLTLPDTIHGEASPDPNPGNPALHARLAFVFREDNDRQRRWGFRLIPQDSPISFQSRLRAAMTACGLDANLKWRRLVVLRADPPPAGAKSAELVREFLEAGGAFVVPTREDFSIFGALRKLDADAAPGFDAWLRMRKPLFATRLFSAASLAPPEFLSWERMGSAPPAPEPPAPPAPPPERPAPSPPSASVTALAAVLPPSSTRPTLVGINDDAGAWRPPATDEIPIGRAVESGAILGPVALATRLLPRHVAIVADAGAGKSILLSRLVEEAALLGVPSLVLDANNDLSRLGQPWPSRPTEFSDEDARKAKAYFGRTEVVVWTPGVRGGRPLVLNLLPDFAALGFATSPAALEERERAVEMALATLEPYLPSRGAGAIKQRGVLADALRVFAQAGGGSLDDLVRWLADLPGEASRIPDAGEIAGEVADQLVSAIAAHPSLQMSAPALDLAQLFKNPAGKTRVSVVNLSGLGGDAARQAFVNQLQMALFGWIKENPSPTPRLYALDEAHIYTPAKEGGACKRSALALVDQARKYGLGMIFATGTPRGVDPSILSSCRTHFYGRVSSSGGAAAIEEMMAAKGGAAEDFARLKVGEFYFSSEGLARPLKVRTPLCLTRRGQKPPTTEEVAELARRRA